MNMIGDTNELVVFYSQNLRSSFFAGFLTLGGFLFSAKTFIVVKMKEGVYDTRAYAEHVVAQRQLGSKAQYYGPLRNLTRLLFWSILLAMLTAVSQLTIGLIKHAAPVLVCIILAGVTISLLIASLFLIHSNLKSWFDQMEKAKSGSQKETYQIPERVPEVSRRT